MEPSVPKDNANPTVLRVEKARSSARREPLTWSQLGSFELCSSAALDESSDEGDARRGVANGSAAPDDDDDDDDWEWIPTTAEDRSVLCALSDISNATRGKGVSLLTNAGLVIPDSTTAVLTKPALLVPSHPSNNGTAARETAIEDLVSTDADRLTLTRGNLPSSASSRSRQPSRERLDREEIFDIIRNIQDPEHPHTLEQLSVVNIEHVQVYDALDSSNSQPHTGDCAPPNNVSEPSRVEVRFTPTIPHCSMATLIGLCLRVKLLRSLPSRFKISVQIQPGTHASENAINKQLRDKERVRAALENKHLAGVVNKCIKGGMYAQ